MLQQATLLSYIDLFAGLALIAAARPDRIPAAAARSRSSTEQLECGRVFVTSFDCSRRL